VVKPQEEAPPVSDAPRPRDVAPMTAKTKQQPRDVKKLLEKLADKINKPHPG
jgi:hypothetical protein